MVPSTTPTAPAAEPAPTPAPRDLQLASRLATGLYLLAALIERHPVLVGRLVTRLSVAAGHLEFSALVPAEAIEAIVATATADGATAAHPLPGRYAHLPAEPARRGRELLWQDGAVGLLLAAEPPAHQCSACDDTGVLLGEDDCATRCDHGTVGAGQ